MLDLKRNDVKITLTLKIDDNLKIRSCTKNYGKK